MKLQIFAVKDNAVDTFSTPWFAPTIGLAIRSFGDETQNDNSPMHKHPGDFFLFHLGEFDQQSASFDGQIPKLISKASDFLKPNTSP